MGKTIASIAGTVGNWFQYKTAKKERKLRKRMYYESMRRTDKLMQQSLADTQGLMSPVFSDRQIGLWQAQARDELTMSMINARRQLDSMMAMRGVARSGVAQDLYMRMRLQQALNTVRQQQDIAKQAMLANRQALLNAVNLRHAIRSGGMAQMNALTGTTMSLNLKGAMFEGQSLRDMWYGAGNTVLAAERDIKDLVGMMSGGASGASAGFAAGMASATASRFYNPLKSGWSFGG